MTVTVELSPEVAERVAEEARARGVELTAYIRKVLEDSVSVPAALPMDVNRLNAMFDRLAEMGKGLPVLSDYAVSREGIYEDHD